MLRDGFRFGKFRRAVGQAVLVGEEVFRLLFIRDIDQFPGLLSLETVAHQTVLEAFDRGRARPGR